MNMNDDWLNFWFTPQLFFHGSWFAALDQRLLSAKSSSLAWNTSYDYVCDVLRLPVEVEEPCGGLAGQIIKDLMQNDRSIVNLATVMVSSKAIDSSMSIDIKRKILQRNRALSLKKRFAQACDELSDNEFGVYFIYLAVMLDTPKLWRRVRLMFKRDTVEKVERAGRKIPRSEVNTKAIRRAWKEIYVLKGVVRPQHGLSDFLEPIDDKTHVVSNDDSHDQASREQNMSNQNLKEAS